MTSPVPVKKPLVSLSVSTKARMAAQHPWTGFEAGLGHAPVAGAPVGREVKPTDPEISSEVLVVLSDHVVFRVRRAAIQGTF